MLIQRYRHPGTGPKQNVYNGALSPRVRRVNRKASVTTSGPNDGPVFGRRVWARGAATYEFGWAALTHVEAREVFRRWEDARGGSSVLYYTPDDLSVPITVIAFAPPSIEYINALVANVVGFAMEQR